MNGGGDWKMIRFVPVMTDMETAYEGRSSEI